MIALCMLAGRTTLKDSLGSLFVLEREIGK
nr:MAG TPA: hypothetical protein [Caudoviricetes sp.]